jgi:hypothetical protein
MRTQQQQQFGELSNRKFVAHERRTRRTCQVWHKNIGWENFLVESCHVMTNPRQELVTACFCVIVTWNFGRGHRQKRSTEHDAYTERCQMLTVS